MVLTKKDFSSNQQVRWCPGCGDYSILSSIQNVMPKLGVPKEKIVFISGIGCSSRFPHYMSTYGFHTIHGRAPAFATGLKLANPELSVWVITGDGDGLSIGGNHLIHILRRNVDLNIILFNNKIYGLTKGQYSPTSDLGTIAKSTPFGSLDRSFNPSSLAIGAGATFFARTVDNDPKHMQEVFLKASEHKGTSLVEVLQNCVIFNDKVHSPVASIENRLDHQFKLESGERIIFGKQEKKTLVKRKQGFGIEIIKLEELESERSKYTEEDVIVHNQQIEDPGLHYILGSMADPIALGVIRAVENISTYENDVHRQISEVKAQSKTSSLEEILNSGSTWVIK